MKTRMTLVLVAAMALSAAGGWGAARASGRRHINLPGRTVTAPFSEAVLVRDTLYVAGRLGPDPATGRPPGGAVASRGRLLAAIAVLALGGSGVRLRPATAAPQETPPLRPVRLEGLAVLPALTIIQPPSDAPESRRRAGGAAR